ncbi:filamentous haemagglutinin family protein [Bradyrhizobium sp. LHD-71]|uniref:filamentous haemagglutinin family protein n=1 Tax=Bradyrhizobium sp. LHD-71 TaxID=3072141 RepID=UPI00280CDB7D|nr:filamentous haemagglutinin family protein [Bradyrhizobium sp. LHD-71]MDQ8731862.1 filamentous hemagglutinin family protein [Bradyrhizobium sp. LHD-71]
MLALTLAAPGAEARPLGGRPPSPSAAAVTAAQSGAAEASRVARQAQNALKRATLAIQVMQATQQAARDAARAALQAAPSGIPHGLKPGGLQVASGAAPGTQLWQGANLPTEFQDGDRIKVTVQQTQEKAILNWQTFNVSERTDLKFDQKTYGGTNAGNWIALNRVNDPSTSPSRILGSVTADGQVYLINRNGIIFGGTSQVNVGTLIASSLALSNEQFMAGINNSFVIEDGQGGTHWGIPQFGEHATGHSGQGAPFAPSGVSGDVTVEAGAQLRTGSGGKLMLFGPRIANAGRLEATDGQVILAAGEQVWLAPDLSGVRGFDVAVSAPAPWLLNHGEVAGALDLGAVYDPGYIALLRTTVLPGMEARAITAGYNVTNTGAIHSERGNITLQSREVVQHGALTATSALNSREGSIRLRAWGQGMMAHSSSLDRPQMLHWSAGTLTLRPDSVTAVTPDLNDRSEIEQSALATRYKPGKVELRGKLIDVQSLASVLVPSGNISAVASAVPISSILTPANGPSEDLVQGDATEKDGSRVYIDRDAYLSVAGVQDVLVAMERNFIEAQLYINELRDTPLYRDSWLRGTKVVVDRRVSGLFGAGPMSGVQWVQDEAGNYIPGAWVGTPLADVTGWVGLGKTDLQELSTRGGSIILKAGGSVITRAGSLLDVSGGSVRYSDGWNNTTKLLGADGRIYNIGAAMPDQTYVALGGGFTRRSERWGITETWTGPLSKSGRTFERGYTEGRDAGKIAIYSGEALVLEGDMWGGVIVGERQALGDLPRAGSLEIGGGGDDDRGWTPADLIITARPVVLPDDFAATTPVGERYYRPDIWPLSEKTTWLAADMLSQSGLGTLDLFVTSSFAVDRGSRLELDAGASLSVKSNASTGVVFDIDGTIRIAGGEVSLGMAGVGLRNIDLGANAVIDVSGEWINERIDGPLVTRPAIHGGTISLSAITMSVESGARLDVSGGGYVWLKAGKSKLEVGDAGEITLPKVAGEEMARLELRAFAAGSGGSLSFEIDSSVQLGGIAPTDPSILHVPGSLYAERGFRSVSILAYGDIIVPDGATIEHAPYNVQLNSGYLDAASGARITDVGTVGILPPHLRAGLQSTELALSTTNGDITVGAEAVVRTDPGGRVALSAGRLSSGDVIIRGVINAPAGTIVLTAAEELRLAAGGSLLARGTPLIFRDGRGLRSGKVLPGGSVSLEASNRLMVESDSLIDVSGASGEIDVPRGGLRGNTATTVQLASDAGTISIKGIGTIEGKLVGRPGGAGAAGGKLLLDHLGAPASEGDQTPGEMIWSRISWMDPTCQMEPFTCEGQSPLGFDFGLILEAWDWADNGKLDFGDRPEMIITQALIDRLSLPTRSELIVSDKAARSEGIGAIDLAKFGLTEEALDLLRDNFIGSDILRESLRSPPGDYTLLVRPAALTAGGFADLQFNSSDAIRLDGVSLSSARSIVLQGPISNAGALSSTIHAPHIGLEFHTSAAVSASTAGTLTLTSNVIDITGGSTIRGFSQTLFEASDVRLTARQQQGTVTPTALLDVEGNLVLRTGQVYPSTGIVATIKASDRITVERLGDAALPLSAGASLTLDAPVIEQNGTLRAPLGQITLKASDRLVLGAGSITSVSGDGLIVPYGYLSNGEYWLPSGTVVDPSDPAKGNLVAPPEKRITLEAPVVDTTAGSVIDIRGGGDLYAREFVPGPGGSHDILATANTYAVIPGFSGIAPAGGGMDIGERIWLAGGNGLAAGWYTLLPATYATLPGAYAVSLAADGLSSPMPRSIPLADGSMMMNGRRGNGTTGVQDQLASSWRVMTGAQLRRYTEYNEAFANTFFGSDAFKLTQYRLTGQDVVTPRLPMDGGSVVFKATQQLILDGSLRSQAAAGGRGGLVDIAGARIAIAGAGADAAALRADGYLVIDAVSLSNFGAGSLLIGGTRKGDPLGLRLDVIASDIVVRNDGSSALTGPEIILAASGLVDVGAGSVILAKGEAAVGASDLVITPQEAAIIADPDGWDDGDPSDDIIVTPSKDYGALIRISNGDAVRVLRENVDIAIGGVVKVGAAAQLRGGASLLIDATSNTELDGTASLSGASLSVASGRIGFGGGNTGLVLSLDSLRQLAATRHLTLRSYTSMDFHASFDLGSAGLASVTFDAAGLAGHSARAVMITGGTIALENTGGSMVQAGNGTGTLNLVADELVLGRGTKEITGFSSVVLTGTRQIIGEGAGRVNVGDATLTLVTPVLTGRGGAAQTLATTGALRLTGAGSGPKNALDSLGTRLILQGGSVDVASHIVALGGAVEVIATAGNVVLGSGAVIDVGGFGKQFYDVAEYADAGRIALTASRDVRLLVGSALNLAAPQGGGNAGALSVKSDGGAVAFDGAITAQTGTGGKGGSFALDINELDYAAMNERLNAAGFTRSRQFRIRTGDVVITGVAATEDFQLSADVGLVTIAGTVDARATYGGSILIGGGGGLAMTATADLRAGATSNLLGSGRVTLEAGDGMLEIRAGRIDVAGGEGGKVRFRARQTTGHDEIAVTTLNATITGARSTVLEGLSVYESATTEAIKDEAKADATTFATNAGAIAARLGLAPKQVMAGIEIRSNGDLTVDGDWNLYADFATQREGTLTLRAAGNLLINGHISDGFHLADRTGILQDAASWDIRLVAGADLDSADALALAPLTELAVGKGSLTVGSASAGKLVRTGTGDIIVRVGRDLNLAHEESVIYTAGRRDTTAWPDFTTVPSAFIDNQFVPIATAAYGIEGGHLDIAAQGNVSSVLSDPANYQFFGTWLDRMGSLEWGPDQGPATLESHFLYPYNQSTWFVNYAVFNQGVGALGGGNVSVSAGGDINDLTVALPTNGRVRGGRTEGERKLLELRNGGALTVDAGGAIHGGQYYIGRGEGAIMAGELAISRGIANLAPVLALGDSALSVKTSGAMHVATVADPLLSRVPLGTIAWDIVGRDAFMSGYTNDTALSLVAVGGDVTLGGSNPASLPFFADLVAHARDRYAARTHIAALNGSIINRGAIYTMPGDQADFRLVADADVVVGTIVMSRAPWAIIPQPFMPMGRPSGDPYHWWGTNIDVALVNDIVDVLGDERYRPRDANPERLPLADDYEPSRIYSRSGSINGGNILSNEQTWLRAGEDIRALSLNLRNNHPTDVSLLEAGNDIQHIAGSFQNDISFNTLWAATIQGPGALLLTAGRDIYNSNVVSTGNKRWDPLTNRPILESEIRGLPEQGAAISLMAGLQGKRPAYEAFKEAYLDPANVATMPDYLKATMPDGSVLPIYLTDLIEVEKNGQQKTVRRGLVSFIADMTGEMLSPMDAWARFQALPEFTREVFLRRMYMQELRDAGRDQNTPDSRGQPYNGGYNRGYAAIEAMFPGSDWRGDVVSQRLLYRTMAGGDIEVLTPGGGLQVAALGTSVPAGAGLITLGSGHINIFTRDDVVVNRSRILTFVPSAVARGNDMIIWSTLGDIDAGRGAKTLRTPSAPDIETDLDGNTKILERPDVEGSGIGTIGDGDVDLVAPGGTVNAGDAGIRVARNFNVAALQVLNVGNIQIGGNSKGIPVVEVPSIAGLTEASNVAGAAAQQATTPAASSGAAQASIIIVEVLGFGGGDGTTPDEQLESRRERRSSLDVYDPNSAVNMLGNGKLSDEQKKRLTDEERSRLNALVVEPGSL